MMQLSEELTSTENKVAFARQGLQRFGDGLQQRAGSPSEQHRGRHVQFPAGEPPEVAKPEAREAPKVSFT